MRPERDEEIESRITMEAVVDAYGAEERAIGWYYYLENELDFPLRVRCRKKDARSPAKVGKFYRVIGMADVEDCTHDMYVMVDFGEDQLALRLAQLEPLESASETTCNAVKAWHYWIDRGYEF